jgi:hypothetical protein
MRRHFVVGMGFDSSYIGIGGPLLAQAYTLIRGLGEYAAAREQFNYLVDRLQSKETAGMEHGEIEELIRADGMELLRRLLQGHLNLRAAREVKRSGVEGTDGVIRPHCRKGCRRDLVSGFGPVEVQRLGYGVGGGSSLFPLDGELNLPEDKYSHGLRRRVAEEVGRISFDEAVVSVVKTTGGKVPKRQAEGLAAEIVQGFEAFYEGRGATLPEETRGYPLVMSLDGKGLVMRPDSLREATRKAAAGECHKLKTRLGRAEKRNRKRMATVATVYSIEGQVRNAEAIRGLKEADDTHKPRAQNKRGYGPVWSESLERLPTRCFKRRYAVIRPRGTSLGYAGGRRGAATQGYKDLYRVLPSGRHPHPRFHPCPRIPLESRLLLSCRGQ